MLIASIDWTSVLVALIAGVPASIAAIASLSNHLHMRVPSGGKIGETVDRTHTLAAAAALTSTETLRRINGGAATVSQPGDDTPHA